MDFASNTNDKIPQEPKVAFKIDYGGFITHPTASSLDETGHENLISEALKKGDRQTEVDNLIQKMSNTDEMF